MHSQCLPKTVLQIREGFASEGSIGRSLNVRATSFRWIARDSKRVFLSRYYLILNITPTKVRLCHVFPLIKKCIAVQDTHHSGRRTVFNAPWFWKDFQNAMSFQNTKVSFTCTVERSHKSCTLIFSQPVFLSKKEIPHFNL